MRALRFLPITACLISGIAIAGPLEVLSVRASLSGSFTQSIVSPDGVELERAEGQFQLLRPHFFGGKLSSQIGSCWSLSTVN